ncbi:MAG TPA: hypothetical protein VHX20_07955 [Terracidiphilus sp.]|jgi:hypothetical protein|nr:hypothetical protein [Terracidiphilus sp.]
MELGPIPVVRSLTAVKELPVDFQLSAVMDINGLSRPGDRTRSGARRKSASTSSDESDDVTIEGVSQSPEEQTVDPPGHVNFFA